MHFGSAFSLDPATITGDWERWNPVPREEAVRACAYRWVAVVYTVQGMPMADWLSPESRFFRADQPLLFGDLRYYAHAESRLGRLKPVRVHRPLGEMELLEALDEAGEPVHLGSPLPEAEKKPKPKLPIEFRLTDKRGRPMPGLAYEAILPDGKAIRGKSGPDGIILFPDNIHPGEAKLKLFPGHAHTPADASRGSGTPALGAEALEAAELLADLPGLPAIPRPIEVLLLDEHGVPMGGRAFTARFPDGKVETGRSDRSGLIRFPDNTQSGDMLLTLTDAGTGAFA